MHAQKIDPRPVCVKFVVTKWQWGGFCTECFGFPLSVSFHQCSTLIFTHTLLLPEGQTGEAWEASNKTVWATWDHGIKGTFRLVHTIKCQLVGLGETLCIYFITYIGVDLRGTQNSSTDSKARFWHTCYS